MDEWRRLAYSVQEPAVILRANAEALRDQIAGDPDNAELLRAALGAIERALKELNAGANR